MNQVHSPFKFLDSYQQADADVFFGREKETIDLYNALSGVKHLLVYGPSGSGKTSLIECGLRNQFSDADWYAITIRKGTNINASVFASINKALTNKIEIDPGSKMPADAHTEFGQAVEKLFAERYQPVYLLFDQFEELLISGEAEEKKKFFTLLNKLIRNKVPCRIMLIMREEFIGHLSEFEPLCPSIFQHRFRVEKMGRKNVEKVIYDILEAPRYRSYFIVDNSQKLAESILSKLPDKRKEIELAHVQVFLGELWDRAQATKQNDQLPVLSAELINDDDDLEGVLESFLKKQMRELDEVYGERVSLELLAAMISEKYTKLQVSEKDLEKDLEHKKVVSKKAIADLLKELEQRRIVRTIKVGDEIQYEISHDVLALVVGQNLTEEMKLREKAGDIYKVYGERQGLFTQDDIDYLRPFQQSLSYPAELQARIEKSVRAIRRGKRKKIGIYFLILLTIIAFLIAYSVQSRITEIKALNAKAEAEAAEQKTKDLLKIVLKGRGEQYINQDVKETIERLNLEQTYPIDSLIVPRATSVPVSGTNNYDFLIWIDVPSFRAAEIKEVEYKWTCKGFVDSVHIGSKPSLGFAFGYRGWGYCPIILIKVLLKNGENVPIRFELGKYLQSENGH
jgi:GTPase SAR1 family protein